VNYHERVAMLADCWSIIDQGYALCKLFERSTKIFGSADTSAFIARHQSTLSEMRNWMDHLYQRIPQRSAMKGPVPPFLGSFTFYVKDGSISEAGLGSIGYAAVTITHGIVNDQRTEQSGMPLDRFPIDMIGTCEFEAFGRSLRIRAESVQLASYPAAAK
jgi:hypothetical protein